MAAELERATTTIDSKLLFEVDSDVATGGSWYDVYARRNYDVAELASRFKRLKPHMYEVTPLTELKIASYTCECFGDDPDWYEGQHISLYNASYTNYHNAVRFPEPDSCWHLWWCPLFLTRVETAQAQVVPVLESEI
jgi:hypothetical protein